MMHVLCEEYETVYAACLIMTSAVLGVDFGYDVNAQGELEYVVQIEPEMLESLKAGEKITLGRPPNVDRIQVFRLQIGNDELSKVVPASYQKPVSDSPKELAPLSGNPAVLTEPPVPELAADSKPFLSDDLLADYGSGSSLTRQPPYGATSGGVSSSGSGTAGASSIPGADARYGISQNFSVPASTGITRPASATVPATNGSGTVSDGNSLRPIGSGNSPTSGNVPPPPAGSSSSGSSFTGDPMSGSNDSTQGSSGSNASGRPYSGWGSSNQSNVSGAGGSDSSQASGGGSVGGETSSNATNGSNFPRYGQQGNGSSTAGNPSDRTNEVSTGLGGSSPNYGTGGMQNNGSTAGGNTAPPLYNGGSSYGGSGNQTVQPSPPANNGNQSQDSSWLTGGMTSGQGGGASNNQNQGSPGYAGANGLYPPQQQPVYNQQPTGYNNGAAPYPPQGYNATNPGYNGQNYPPYLQPPYLTNPAYQQLASLPPYAMQAQNNQVPTAPTTSNTAAKPAEEEPTTAKEPPTEPEIVEKPPEWWQLLALGFLISICANAYMFMTTQDFRRKYQDLLEDVRDLRTLSND